MSERRMPQPAPISKLHESRTEKRARFVNPFAGLWRRIYDLFHHDECYVVVDPCDNSVTLSGGLCRKIDVEHLTNDKVWVGQDKNGNYLFLINCNLNDEETQLTQIQYNSKYKSYGFETLTPSVNMMYYHWGLNDRKPRKLAVQPTRMQDVWQIISPSN